MANLIIGAIVVIAFAFALWKTIKNRRNGNCSCGSSCCECSGCKNKN